MSRKTIYVHHSYLFVAILLAVLIVVVGLVFFGAIAIAFKNVGFTPFTILLLLAATLIGSFINIPLLKLKANVPLIREESVSRFGMTYRIPKWSMEKTSQQLQLMLEEP